MLNPKELKAGDILTALKLEAHWNGSVRKTGQVVVDSVDSWGIYVLNIYNHNSAVLLSKDHYSHFELSNTFKRISERTYG